MNKKTLKHNLKKKPRFVPLSSTGEAFEFEGLMTPDFAKSLLTGRAGDIIEVEEDDGTITEWYLDDKGEVQSVGREDDLPAVTVIGKRKGTIEPSKDKKRTKGELPDLAQEYLDNYVRKWLQQMNSPVVGYYPGGGSSGNNPTPTYADSLALYNNALAKAAFYDNNPLYKKVESYTDFTNPKVREHLVARVANNKNITGHAIGEKQISFFAADPKHLGEKRFGKVPGTNLVSFGDVLTGDPNIWFNPSAPPIYLHPNISPQGSHGYSTSPKFSEIDMSDVPYYDPIAVKPAKLLTPKEKAYRIKKYGTRGITPKQLDPAIVAKQKELINAGYDIGKADGIWGPKSQKAWKEYQESKNRPVPEAVVIAPPVAPLVVPPVVPPPVAPKAVTPQHRYRYVNYEGEKSTMSQAEENAINLRMMEDLLKMRATEKKALGGRVLPADVKKFGEGGIVRGGTKKVQDYQKFLNQSFNAGLKEDGAWGKKTQVAYEKYVVGADRYASQTLRKYPSLAEEADVYSMYADNAGTAPTVLSKVLSVLDSLYNIQPNRTYTGSKSPEETLLEPVYPNGYVPKYSGGGTTKKIFDEQTQQILLVDPTNLQIFNAKGEQLDWDDYKDRDWNVAGTQQAEKEKRDYKRKSYKGRDIHALIESDPSEGVFNRIDAAKAEAQQVYNNLLKNNPFVDEVKEVFSAYVSAEEGSPERERLKQRLEALRADMRAYVDEDPTYLSAKERSDATIKKLDKIWEKDYSYSQFGNIFQEIKPQLEKEYDNVYGHLLRYGDEAQLDSILNTINAGSTIMPMGHVGDIINGIPLGYWSNALKQGMPACVILGTCSPNLKRVTDRDNGIFSSTQFPYHVAKTTGAPVTYVEDLPWGTWGIKEHKNAGRPYPTNMLNIVFGTYPNTLKKVRTVSPDGKFLPVKPDLNKTGKYQGGGKAHDSYKPVVTDFLPTEQSTTNVFEELKNAVEYLYTQKKTKDDSALENILEIIDPTGITSWDDIYRSYNKTGLSKETFLEMVGALPIVGKFGKGVKATSKMAKELLKDISLIGSTSKRGMPLAPFIIPPLAAGMSAPYIGRGLDAIDAYNQYPTSPGVPGGSYILPEITIKANRNNKK